MLERIATRSTLYLADVTRSTVKLLRNCRPSTGKYFRIPSDLEVLIVRKLIKVFNTCRLSTSIFVHYMHGEFLVISISVFLFLFSLSVSLQVSVCICQPTAKLRYIELWYF